MIDWFHARTEEVDMFMERVLTVRYDGRNSYIVVRLLFPNISGVLVLAVFGDSFRGP